MLIDLLVHEGLRVAGVVALVVAIPPVADEAIKIGAKVLWLQLGIRNDEVGRKVQAAGLAFVQNRCIKIEHARFFGGLHTVGLNTGVILAKKAE